MRLAALAVSVVLLQVSVGGGRDKPEKSLAADLGAHLYRVHCAVCHGARGEGDGPFADQLRFAPPDLTRLAKRNKGKFDSDKVLRIVDGRRAVKGHGGPEMPIWGEAFRESRDGYSPEGGREKLEQIVEFLKGIQKP